MRNTKSNLYKGEMIFWDPVEPIESKEIVIPFPWPMGLCIGKNKKQIAQKYCKQYSHSQSFFDLTMSNSLIDKKEYYHLYKVDPYRNNLHKLRTLSFVFY